MWQEASILLSFAVGMTLVYAGLERLFAGRRKSDGENGAQRRASSLMRGALIGVALAALGALAVYYAVRQLNSP
ncbi:MAG TPA: hypothetical protein VER32_07765 [Pyrinomonadaceae bacterium]|nr:hypothetical protein [Pyrinomonadaceae bacterium]